MEENKEMELETGDEQEKDVLALLEDYFDERIVRAVKEMGFEKLTPIQEQAIPYLLDGEDIIVLPGNWQCRQRTRFAK